MTERQLDRITRIVSVIVVLAALAAFGVLFLVPDRTDTLFSWTITPTMSARLMGAGYISGAYIFTRVALGTSWRSVRAPMLGLAVFSVITLATTLLHLDRFHHGTFPFVLWTGLYALLTIVMFPLWFANERIRREPTIGGDPTVPRRIRFAAAAAGIGAWGLALAMFLVPDLVASVWPWQLTPLTARASAAWYAVAGTVPLVLYTIDTWSGWRMSAESGSILLGFLLLGSALSWSEFDPGRILTWAFVLGTAALFVAVLALYVAYQRQNPAARTSAGNA